MERLHDLAHRVVEARPLAEVWDVVRKDLVETLDATDIGEEAPIGRVVLRGDARHAVDIDDRLFALTLMGLLALAIAQSPGESLSDLAPMPAHPRAVND